MGNILHLNGFTRTDQPIFFCLKFLGLGYHLPLTFFTRVMRQLVKFWRKQTEWLLILDDGIAGAKTRSLAFEQIQMTGDFSFKISYEIEHRLLTSGTRNFCD